MTTKLCGRLDKLAVVGFVSLLSAGMLQAASISLVAPDDGATYDTHSPCVKEFYANFEKRGVKPPRPELTEDEKKQKAEEDSHNLQPEYQMSFAQMPQTLQAHFLPHSILPLPEEQPLCSPQILYNPHTNCLQSIQQKLRRSLPAGLNNIS